MLLKPISMLRKASGGGAAGLSVLLAPTARIEDSTNNITAYSSSAFTAQTGSNRLMLIAVGGWVPGTSTDTTISSITYGAQAATEVVNRDVTPAEVGFGLFYIKEADIPAGSNQLTVNWSFNSRSCTAVVLELAGVDQTTPVPTTGTLEETTIFAGTALTPGVTTANADSYLVSAMAYQGGDSPHTLACTEGTEGIATTGTSTSTDSSGGMAYELIATAGAETHTWTSDLTAKDGAAVAIEVKAA